jgi:2-polyprenyl-6-methoxyphenol hydroxylase-like FAD-dependent oxidoreductase
VRKVVIVGGGPAGLCAAAVLGSRGIGVEVVGVNPDLHPQGVGLAVIGPSLRAPLSPPWPPPSDQAIKGPTVRRR